MLRIGSVLLILVLVAVPGAWADESPSTGAGGTGTMPEGIAGPALPATSCSAASAGGFLAAAQPPIEAQGCFRCASPAYTGPTETAIDSTCTLASGDLTRALRSAASSDCLNRGWDGLCTTFTVIITSPCSGSSSISVSGYARYNCLLNIC
jgi:hypothetical protein